MTVVADDSRIILVGDRDAKAAVDAVCERMPVAGVVGTDSTLADHFPDIDQALQSTAAGTICLLSPKQVAFESIRRIVSAGINILCGGPISATATQCAQLEQQAQQHGVRIRMGGRERHEPRLKRMQQLRASDAFGEPVYARCVTGGGTSMNAAWWSMCELLASATWLLQSTPVRMVIGATRSGRARLHVTMTVGMDNRANAQLCVAPGREGALADTWLLGTGGTISSRCEDGDIIVTRPDQRHVIDTNPTGSQVEWITDFIADKRVGLQMDAAALNAKRRLLQVMRRALKEGVLCAV